MVPRRVLEGWHPDKGCHVGWHPAGLPSLGPLCNDSIPLVLTSIPLPWAGFLRDGIPPRAAIPWSSLQRFYTTCSHFDPAPLGGVGHCLQYPFLEACARFDIGAKCLSLRAFTIWPCRSQSIRWRPSSKSPSPTPNPAGGALQQ
jgi:hypothetical protein